MTSLFIEELAKAAQAECSQRDDGWEKIPASRKLWKRIVRAVFARAAEIGPSEEMIAIGYRAPATDDLTTEEVATIFKSMCRAAGRE